MFSATIPLTTTNNGRNAGRSAAASTSSGISSSSSCGVRERSARDRTELDLVFAELKRRPLPDIVVIGHTDTVGALAYNDRLSLARAERLREMLIEMGLPAVRIQAAGRGKRELLVPTDDNVSEPRNRRVEINVR